MEEQVTLSNLSVGAVEEVETIEFTGRCCVCTDQARVKYERTKVDRTQNYQFRCVSPPIHEQCKAQFLRLQIEKSGNNRV